MVLTSSYFGRHVHRIIVANPKFSVPKLWLLFCPPGFSRLCFPSSPVIASNIHDEHNQTTKLGDNRTFMPCHDEPKFPTKGDLGIGLNNISPTKAGL